MKKPITPHGRPDKKRTAPPSRAELDDAERDRTTEKLTDILNRSRSL